MTNHYGRLPKPFVWFKKIKGIEHFKNELMDKFEPVGLKITSKYIQVISLKGKNLKLPL